MLFFNEIESYIVGMFCHIIFVQIAISGYFVGFFFFFFFALFGMSELLVA